MLGTQRVQQWMAAVQPLPALLLAEDQASQHDRPDGSPCRDVASTSGCNGMTRTHLAEPPTSGEPLRRAAGPLLDQDSTAGSRLVITLPRSADIQLCKAVAAFFGTSHSYSGGGCAANASPISSFALQAKEATAVSLLIVLTEQALLGKEDISCSSPCENRRAYLSSDGSDTATSSSSNATINSDSTSSTESSQLRAHDGRQSPSRPFDGSATDRNTHASLSSNEQGLLSQPPPKQIGLTHPITQLFAALTREQLCRVLLAMRVHSPASLEGLLLYALPPAATEVLLSGLEAAQQLTAMQAHGPDFYGAVWSVAPSSKKLLSTLLARKELCCEMACRQVLTETIGW